MSSLWGRTNNIPNKIKCQNVFKSIDFTDFLAFFNFGLTRTLDLYTATILKAKHVFEFDIVYSVKNKSLFMANNDIVKLVNIYRLMYLTNIRNHLTKFVLIIL